jgi:hypothetical protein
MEEIAGANGGGGSSSSCENTGKHSDALLAVTTRGNMGWIRGTSAPCLSSACAHVGVNPDPCQVASQFQL